MRDDLEGVKWGAAIAAYQVEGGAASGGRSPSIWDTFSRKPGAVLRGDTGDVAAAVFENPGPMLDNAEWLGLDVLRVSISWSRLIPGGDGEVSEEGVAFYRHLFGELRSRNVTPVVTLYHWDLPQRLQDRGGWSSMETVEAFVEYVEKAVALFKDLVQDWVTINEPFCTAFHGHLSGLHAPGIRDEAVALRVALMQMKGHGDAVRAIRRVDPSARVGLAINLSDLEAASESDEDLQAYRTADLIENRLFLVSFSSGRLPDGLAEYFGEEVIAHALEEIDVSLASVPLDFIGLNYYEHNVISASQGKADTVVRGVRKLPVPEPRSANGVATRPDGFIRTLLRVSEAFPGVPVWVTENGIALHDYLDPSGLCNDIERVDYLDRHVEAVAEARRRGVNVEAYFHWCLMDTFEWSYGYQLKYGLLYVDFPTSRLIPKASAHHYRELIAQIRQPEPKG